MFSLVAATESLILDALSAVEAVEFEILLSKSAKSLLFVSTTSLDFILLANAKPLP